MASLSTTEIYEFDRFHLDRRGLFERDKRGALAPVEIGSRALDVLRVLLERPGDLVTRDEIMIAAWPGIVVEDGNLTIQIAALRRMLDQDRANGSCIQTVPRRGYRFVGAITRVEPAGAGDGVGGPPAERKQTPVIGAQGKTHRATRAISRARYGLWGGAAAAAIGVLILMAAVGSSGIRWPWDPPAPRACRLSCCPSLISAAIRRNNILPTGLQRM